MSAQNAETVRYDHSQDHVPGSPECWDKCGDPDVLSPVKRLHSPIQVEVVGWACANEDCDHDDVDECLAAGGLATTCRHCHELREEANQWDEGLAILPWPCPTAALWFDGTSSNERGGSVGA